MKKIKKALLSFGLACLCSFSCALLVSCGDEDENKVNISYDTMGATEIPSESLEIGTNYTLPAPAQREGYKFLGWYATNTFEGEPITGIVVSADATYYAKWVQAYAVNLDANGGSLSTKKLYLAAGDNVYEALKDLVPEKANLTFGGWFNGTQELSKTYSMTSEALNLKAQYKVAYTVNIYLQNMEGTDYVKSSTTTGLEYVGKNFTSKQKQTGFTDVTDQATVQKVLSENPAENVFNHYFNRNTYTLTLNSNNPNGTDNQIVSYTKKFGEKINLPSNPAEYVSEGYCFLGWTNSKTSQEVTYAADLDALLYEGAEDAETLEYTIESTTTLYGVWQKGYEDMFGGNDYIYYRAGTQSVYLSRGNVYFKGEFDAEENEFFFDNGLEGKFCDGGKFLYYDTSSDRMKTCKLYVVGEGIIENTIIRLKKDDSLTYQVYDETDVEIEYSEGTYEILENGEYYATFTSGDRQGQTLNFLVGVVKNEDGGTQPAFQVRNDEEASIGEIAYTGILKNADGYYSIGYGQLTIVLDGFGTATLSANGQSETYRYRLEEDGTLVLSDSNDKVVQTLMVYDIPDSKQDLKGYMLYKAELDNTFTFGTNETLTLDGAYQAVYKKGTETIESYYTSTTTPMGNVVVSIIDSKRVEHKFLLTPSSEMDEETGETIVTYTAKSVLNTYAEYYYKDEVTIYYAPMLVVDETQAGKATLYGYTSDRTYVKVSEGSYELGNDGLYVYTVDPSSVETNTGAYADPINLEEIQSFVFAMDTEHTNYSVHFWYSSNDGAATYFTDLANTDISSEATLKLVGGFAFYKEKTNSMAIIGSYTLSENVLTFNANEKDYYFSVDLEDKKFTVLQYAPYQANKLLDGNKQSVNVYLVFDGLGGAVYTKKGANNGEDLLVSGVVTEVKNNGVTTETAFGSVVYQFTPNATEHVSMAFQFIVIKQSNGALFATVQGGFDAGTYFSASASKVSGLLTIDGYCYRARFVADDVPYEGYYYVEDDCIVLVTEEKKFYFDFTEDEFTVRGEEFGSYALFENKYNDNLFVDLDGYGKFQMYSMTLASGSQTEFVRTVIIENGSYQINGEVYTFSDGTTEFNCINNGKSYEDKDGKVFGGLTISQELTTSLFVDTTDRSVLILDEYGRAIRYDKKGRKQVGQYTLITAPEAGDAENTEYLLYFINEQSTFACIYNYNVQTNKATPVELEPRSYYTDDLRSLYFSGAGFAVFNGNTQEECYYTYEGENVVIYRRAKDGETANNCGFVRDEFGTLEETKTYNGALYYRNYGTDISFKRAESEIAKYPVLYTDYKLSLKELIFAPSGGEEFKVSGVAVFEKETLADGKKQDVKENCTITREVVDGTTQMYITIGGAYRYYITASYQGGENTTNYCQVQGLRYVATLPAYRYLDVLYRVYYMYGAATANAYENQFGELTIDIVYGEDGLVQTSSMKATFGEGYELYDQNGNVISFEQSKFEFTANGGKAEFEIQDTEGEGATTYTLHFGWQSHSYLRAQGFYVIALTRMQTLEDNGVEVVVGRVIATDVQGVSKGEVYSIALYEEDTFVKLEEFYKVGDEYICVSRVRGEDNYVTAATYYTITLEENEMEGGSVDEDAVASFKSVNVEKAAAIVVCEKDPTDPNETYKGKDRYVEIVNGEVKFLSLSSNKRYAKSSTYENGIYTVETTDGRIYYVKYTQDNLNVIIATSLEELA